MKKHLFLLLITLLAVIVSYSQSYLYANYYKLAHKDSKNEMIFDDYYTDTDLTFTIRNNYITVDDKANSVYRIIERHDMQYDGKKKLQEFSCTDEKERNCLFSVAIYDNGEKYASVLYEKFAVIYKLY